MTPDKSSSAGTGLSIKVVGLVKFGISLAVMAAVWRLGYAILSPVLFAFGLGGLLEYFTGKSWWEMAARWDALKAWQKAIATLLVVAGTIGFFIALGWIILKLNE